MAAQITDLKSLESQYVVPWEEGQALSVLTMAINVDATNSQTIGFPTLWSKLTNEMSGLGIKYAADHKAIDLIKPPNADQLRFNMVSTLVNMKCATYKFLGLLPGGGRTTPVGDVYVCAHGTYVLTKTFRDPSNRAKMVAATQKLSTALTDMKQNPANIVALIAAIQGDLGQVEWALKFQAGSMPELSGSFIMLAATLFAESHKIQSYVANPDYLKFLGMASSFHIPQTFISSWVDAVNKAIGEKTYRIFTSWQACWSLLGANFPEIISKCDDIQARGKILSNTIRGQSKTEDADALQIDMDLWLSDVQALYNLIDKTMLVLDQYRITSQGLVHPVQALMANWVYTVTNFSVPGVDG